MIVKEIFETEYNYISQLSTINDVRKFKIVGVSRQILILRFCTLININNNNNKMSYNIIVIISGLYIV